MNTESSQPQYSSEDLNPEYTGLQSTEFLKRQEELRQAITPDSEQKLKHELLTRSSGIMNSGEAALGQFRFTLREPSAKGLPPNIIVTNGRYTETVQPDTWHALAEFCDTIDNATNQTQLEQKMNQAMQSYIAMGEGEGGPSNRHQGALEAAVRSTFRV